VGYLRAAVATLGAAGSAWAAVLIVGLLAGVRLIPALWAVLVAAGLVVPAFIATLISTVIDAALSGVQDGFGQTLSYLPRWARTLSSGLFFAFWLAGITSFFGIPGQAEIVNGQYEINNHGDVTIVDKATYDRQVSREERVFLGVLGGFGVGVAALNAGAIRRARSSGA
jgi:hypothetical protein